MQRFSMQIVSMLTAMSFFPVYSSELPTFNAAALLDLHMVRTDKTQSWLQSGLGKTRYGSNKNKHQIKAQVGEASALFRSKLTWSTSAFLHLKLDDKQKHPIDIVEGFVRYKPVPTSDYQWHAKIGAFFPHISLEHTGMGWTSPYTVTPSAINSWVGEELRTVGGEINITKIFPEDEIGLTASIFRYNDPAGTLLGWRGWALHDRKTGLFDRVPLAPLPIISPGGGFAMQAQWVEPFKEIDHKEGYYLGAHWQHLDQFTFNVFFYNNQGNRDVFNGTQYAWETQFVNYGFKAALPWELTLLGQLMQGYTRMGIRPGLMIPLSANFHSYYLLLSKPVYKQQRLSLRFDKFRVRDKDGQYCNDDNQEHGYALTAAYIIPTFEKQFLGCELLWVNSRRPDRVKIGLPRKQKELNLMLSYKIFI